MVKDTEDKVGHSENNEQPNGKCSKGFGVASWTMVEMMKWIDGNLHVGVEVSCTSARYIFNIVSLLNLNFKNRFKFFILFYFYLIWLIKFLLVHFILFQFNFNLIFVLFCFHFLKKYYFKF